MTLLGLFVSLFSLLTISSPFPSNSCDYIEHEDGPIPKIAKYFTTKSRYEEVNPHLIPDLKAIKESWVKPPAAECKAMHLSVIVRHGTRFPTSANIKKFTQVFNLVKNSADLTCIKELQSWTNWYKEDMDGRLVEKGQKDLYFLALRLIKSFPTLISKENVKDERVKFITSSKHRCINSTISFKKGVIEGLNIQDVDLQHTINDELMRFFDTCRRLIETVEKNKTALMEMELFKIGDEMKRVQEKLADRLHLPYSIVNADSVEAAFYLCAYEFTILDQNSPWCRLFDDSDGQVMEYAGDLKQYWKRGFGHDINSKASCILFHDLFKRLDTAAKQIRTKVVVSEPVMVQVGHAETLLPLITLFNLFKDDNTLVASAFSSQLKRFFHSGNITPYAANFLVALYDCPEGVRMQVRLNEQPLTLPGLKDASPLYQDVRDLYGQLLKGCNQETVCRMDS